MDDKKNQIQKSKKPKIVFFSRYPLEFEVIPFPGFREFIENLLSDYDIVYCTMGWSREKNKALRKGINFKELPLKIDISRSMDKWLKTIFYYIILPFSILKVKNENPDVIVCRENMPLVPLCLGVLKKPILVEIGDWWPSVILGSTKIGRRIASLIETFEVRLWNKGKFTALVHNQAEKKVTIARGLSPNKTSIVSSPMFGNNYFPSPAKKERSELGFKKNDFIVATHGIIHRSKGYDQVLYWWANLVKDHPDWKLLFIGGTMGEKWFRRMINDLDLKNKVLITGWVSDQTKLNKYLNTADCLLVTRRNTPDNFGTTPSGLTHSLMTGKPTIVTGMPSIKEIIHDGKDGYLFEPDNYNSFKKSLEEVYKNRKKAKKVGLAGLRRVREYYNAKRPAEQYKELFNQIKS
jgi:glycosyltransferase involved in cell wall biosynthesis